MQSTNNPLYLADGPVCTVLGLLCLQRSLWPIQVDALCVCTKSCTELTYLENNLYRRVWFVISKSFFTFWKTKENIFRSVGDTQFMHKSSFRAEVIPQKVRLKRDIVFSFEDFLGLNIIIMHNELFISFYKFLVSFGGAVSLFLGCSVWKLCKLNFILGMKMILFIYRMWQMVRTKCDSGGGSKEPKKRTKQITKWINNNSFRMFQF